MSIQLRSSSSSDDENQFRRIYEKQLKKKQLQEQLKKEKQTKKNKRSRSNSPLSFQRNITEQTRERSRNNRSRSREIALKSPIEIRWHIYERCPKLILQGRVPSQILQLPIYKKKEQIISTIIKNQFVLITGETGCGKSTQVPRLIYQYLRILKKQKKILCVQPRRLAVLNLHSILEGQMAQKGLVGYQIGMQSHIHPNNQIVFMTNGIFLQRIVHSTAFFEEYPFIILDEVHERDIDTDFILLTLKRIIRKYPYVRVILMSATIDNQLFKYYFASDHIDNILTQENFYKRIIVASNLKKMNECNLNDSPEENDSFNSDNEDKLYEQYGYQFMRSRYPCPAINVTEPGKYKRQYYYLDTVNKFLKEGTINIRWGSIIFNQKYPNTHKQLYQTVNLIISEIVDQNSKNKTKASILIFMPGLAEIQALSQSIYRFFRTEKVQKQFDIIHVHSSILNQDITRKLHSLPTNKFKIIISTNIAQSSITVLGVKYIIDFCLSKQIRFDLKSRMQNLELVWASKASCDQRAGRTGRVCDGVIFRLLEQSFYNKLANYSTPEIQRSSLDKIILRIKMLHENQNNQIFADPGDVLGSAIQPPNLKNIDSSLKSLQFCGGLELRNDNFSLTNLGRLYIDIPIDITYCKVLILSKIFGTYSDILILVAILSQSKNAIRRNNIQKFYLEYYQMMDNPESCDFLALINLYKKTHQKRAKGYRFSGLDLQIYSEVNQLIKDIERRLNKKQFNNYFSVRDNELENQYKRYCRKHFVSEDEEYAFRFKLTIMCGFIENILKIRPPSYDDRQQKRIKHMSKSGISNKNTVCILSSNVLTKPEHSQAEEKLKNIWASHLEKTAKIKDAKFTITHGMSYIHFRTDRDLNKFLFLKYIEENKKNLSDYGNQDKSFSKNYLTMSEILKCLGDIDHMQQGRAVTFEKQQTVCIDNFSLNRIINVNEGDCSKLAVSNNIAKQSSRMVARYTSLLPNIKYLDIIIHLLFYPFVTIITNKKKTKYQFLQLRKAQKIKILYQLTYQQIQKANQIRRKIKNFLHLTEQGCSQYKQINILILEFMFLERYEIMQQQRWQQCYLKELEQKDPQAYQSIEKVRETLFMKFKNINNQYNFDRIFMNDIIAPEITLNYFSNGPINGISAKDRLAGYNQWKRYKLRQVKAIEDKALNSDSYLACGEQSCGLKITKMVKIGSICNLIFRDLYQIEEQNVKQLPFNQMDSHFCSLLMSNYIEAEFNTYGCANGHYFGIRINGENKIKILPFSQLIIIYPDGSGEKADFSRLEVKFWKKKSDEKLHNKNKMKISTYCFICDECFNNFKDLELHIKDQFHFKLVNQFSKSISSQVNVKADEVENSGY